MGESQKNQIQKDEVSLSELIIMLRNWCRYLVSKWLIIVFFGLLGGVFGLWYAANKKPIYTATTTFVLEDEKLSGGGLSSLVGLASIAGMDVNNGGGIFQGDNILELYKSRKMLQQTLFTQITLNGKVQSLADRYIETTGLNKQWLEMPEIKKLKFVADSLVDGNAFVKPNRLRDSLLTKIITEISKNCLNVGKVDKKLTIIKVDVKSEDEIFAKVFNEAIVKNVNDFYLRTKVKKAIQNVHILQLKTDSVRAIMNGAIYTAAAVSDATPNLNPTKQIQRVAPAQKAQFSAETNKAILSSLVQNLEMSKVSLMKETPLLEVIDMPVYPLSVYKVGKLFAIAIGAFIFGFLCCLYFTLKMALKFKLNSK